MDFYDAFWYLAEHKKGKFLEALDIEVVKVNPVTKRIENDPDKNTLVQVWLESGPEYRTHDYMLDCGGNTFEEAIIRLAENVRCYYDEQDRDASDAPITCVIKESDLLGG